MAQRNYTTYLAIERVVLHSSYSSITLQTLLKNIRIMITYIRGIIDELTPTQATIEAHGVGYLLNISLNTYTALQGKSEARLFVYESIREDAWTLCL